MKHVVRRQFMQMAGAAAAVPIVAPLARAQAYPSRSVRVIVPYAPGGVTDIVARLIAQKLSEHLGKQFFVENMPGRHGQYRHQPGGEGRARWLHPSRGIQLLRREPNAFRQDLPTIPTKTSTRSRSPPPSTTVLLVNPSVPAETVKELVALVRANPGKYSYASAGAGTQSHLAGEQFRLSLGLDLVHVPFSGGGPAIASVIAGHTPVGFNSPTTSVQHIKDGKVRALGVTGASRSQSMTDVPTMTEGGYPDIKGDSWVGFLVPAGTPKDIVVLLNREIAKIHPHCRT